MKNLREKTYLRGTADCPFQRYTVSNVKEHRLLADVHWHPEMEILQVEHGAIEVRVGRALLNVSAGQIVFISPGQLHSVRSKVAQSSYFAFVFSLELLTLPESHFFQREVIEPVRSGTMRFPTVITQEDAPYDEVSAALNRAGQVDRADVRYKRVVFSAMLQTLTAMMDTLAADRGDPAHSSSETVKKCLAYMEEHYGRRLTLQELAQQVHLHPNYLCALFKDYTGKTVFAQLAAIRVEKAAELLRSRDISVSTAALTCGFESPGFFTRKFKEIMGVTPKQYSLRYR